MNALFHKYDKDKTGKICYDEFASLIASMGASNQQNLNPVFELSRLPPTQLLNKIKTELLTKVG